MATAPASGTVAPATARTAAPPPGPVSPSAGGPPATKLPPPSVDDFTEGTFVDAQGRRLPYRLFVPRGGSRDGKQGADKVPLVLFLHGSGGRGTDNRGQLSDQDSALVFVKPENQARWPLFMVAPQCPRDQQWVDMPWGAPTGKGKRPPKPTWPLAAALALVDQLQREHSAIDPRRLHVTGMSMGGYGTWDVIARQPARWRSAAIVCGGYDPMAVPPIATAKVPLWAFHAVDDATVPVSRSREMIAALRALGARPRYTEYPAVDGHGHFSWRPAYSDPELLPWMLGPPPGQSAAPPPAPAATRPGSAPR